MELDCYTNQHQKCTVLHPVQNVIALQAQKKLQVFNIKLKQKVKSHANHENVLFWKWINDSTLEKVTKTTVYPWATLNPTSTPVKVFDQNKNLAGQQIITYLASPNKKWMVLVGITINPSVLKVKISMQLHNKDCAISQSIKGHAASFANYC
ncbi:hypothetical protein PTTG_29033 [Puccinia triticina 1-1 BBBD Race 1]|uniref:Clathrin heavy chain linker core motif domain-containing protein n=1 Tax=Puccinia triticina (isolate 1-1 / race 1 (BBBD)) TaxID=630390 RepID=A0A180G790_PUCT1|nr:hypothetical protein PTTG_29033 [Puccinia triticina 1-1 BBBD Race 1]WAR56299.1 hypothetical protein PtB15_7B145 [Puccinia triticina]